MITKAHISAETCMPTYSQASKICLFALVSYHDVFFVLRARYFMLRSSGWSKAAIQSDTQTDIQDMQTDSQSDVQTDSDGHLDRHLDGRSDGRSDRRHVFRQTDRHK
jgi:hypothetical protein